MGLHTHTHMMGGFSKAESLAVNIATWVGGLLSALGSGVIVFIVLRKATFRQDSYHRLLLGLSVADLIFSLGWIVGSFTSDAVWWTSGTTLSCNIAGFLVQLGTTSYVYNGMLSVYFLLVIVYGWTPKRLKAIECFMHAAVWAYAITTAIAGVPLKVYNPVGVVQVCWLGDFPADCREDPNIECLRGNNAKILVHLYVMVPLLAFLTVISCNLFIYVTVRRIQVTRHSARHITSGTGAECVTEEQKRRTRAVAVQSFLYVSALTNSIVWGFGVVHLDAAGILTQDNQSSFFVLLFLCQLFTPAQGILNLMIYLRPRYLRIRAREPDLSKGSAFFRSMGYPKQPKLRIKMRQPPVAGNADEECQENNGKEQKDMDDDDAQEEGPPPLQSLTTTDSDESSSLSMTDSSEGQRSLTAQSVASCLFEV